MEGDVACGDRGNRVESVGRRGGAGILVAAGREVVGLLFAIGGLLRLYRALRRTQDEVEAALLKRYVGAVVVLRRATEIIDRVDDGRRRLEGYRGQAHFLHALHDIFLHRAFRIVTLLGRYRLCRTFFELRHVHCVWRTPRRIDVGDYALASRDALLLQNRLALALDCAANAYRVLVVRIHDKHLLALL